MRALGVVVLVGLVSVDARAEVPLQVPAGWDVKRQEGATVMVPGDLAPGQAYTVVVVTPQTKVGSLSGLLDAARATLGQTATFKPAGDPATSRTDSGWDYQVVIGRLEKDGKALLAQAVAMRKGDEEGIILVISDSVETLQKYSDPFTAMIRGVGASSPPASAAAAGPVDLKYRVPPGWTATNIEGGVLLQKSLNTMYDKYDFRILILPSQPLEGGLRQTFQGFWATAVKASLDTAIVPLPLVRRLGSGMACAFDVDGSAKTKAGVQTAGGLYLLARGKRFVPIMGFFIGYEKALPKDVEDLLESAEIPGSGTQPVPLFAESDLVGSWHESSAEYASYVTSSGSYAGDASIYTGSSLVLNADRSFKRVFIAITRDRRLKEASEGKWSADENGLILRDKDAAKRYSIFGVGIDPKAGSFLVLSTASDTDQRVDLTKPRGAFQGTWYKKE